jgi:hypothetical protein
MKSVVEALVAVAEAVGDGNGASWRVLPSGEVYVRPKPWAQEVHVATVAPEDVPELVADLHEARAQWERGDPVDPAPEA